MKRFIELSSLLGILVLINTCFHDLPHRNKADNAAIQSNTCLSGDSLAPSGRCRFRDADRDGYNDNAPDHDGDGIPNGLDPDWQSLHTGWPGKSGDLDIDLRASGKHRPGLLQKRYRRGAKKEKQ